MSSPSQLKRLFRVSARCHHTTTRCASRKPATLPSFFDHALRFKDSSLPAKLICKRVYSSGPNPSHFSSDLGLRAIYGIIGLNAAVFGAWTYGIVQKDIRLIRTLQENFTVSWKNLSEGRQWTVLTSAFSHNTLPHIAFNMINFYAFATIMLLTPGVGAAHLLALCAGSAIAGSVGFLWHHREAASRSRIINAVTHASPAQSGLGGSGMVMGVGAVAACLMPHAPMNFMFIPVAIPLWAVTLLFAAADAYLLRSKTSLVGHSAHLGGALFGLGFYGVALSRFGGIARMWRSGSRRW